MHLVAVGTEYYKISNIVINSISIDMSYFENLRDAKTAMSAERGIVLECYLSVIDSLSTLVHKFGYVFTQPFVRRSAEPV